MKRRMTFGRGLLVAFVAAILATAIAMAVPFWGMPFSWAALFLIPGYLFAVAPTLRRGVAAGVVVLAILSAVAFVGLPVVEIGLVALAITRAGLLFPSRPLRGIAVECLFVGSGVLLAFLLVAPGALGVGLAVWGFFLVQSAYPLFAGADESVAKRADDPFESAMARANALIEDR